MTNEQKEQLRLSLKELADKGKLDPAVVQWMNNDNDLNQLRRAEISRILDAAFKITPQDIELHFNRLESDPEYRAQVLADLQNCDITDKETRHEHKSK